MHSFTFSKEMISYLFDFGYGLIFLLWGIVLMVVTIPKEKGILSYIRARKVLGAALLTIALYAIIHLILRPILTDYIEFWLLATATLLHSWLAYSSFLFLLETPRYLIRHFLIDGLIPALFLLLAGFIGVFFLKTQETVSIIFGCIFALKSIRMISVCYREYKKCKNELDDYYDEEPDITWIRNLLIISLGMSIATLFAFYFKSIHLYYYLAIPVVYTYIALKIINFMPTKIENIRAKNLYLEAKEEEQRKEEEDAKALELQEKIGTRVDTWVMEKKYCRPELTIKDVALEMGTNHNYLSAYLNKSLNVNFQTWLNTLRIEESKTYLTSGEKMSIEEIGIRVGIPQSYNFSRWFRIVVGKTPLQYKKEHTK